MATRVTGITYVEHNSFPTGLATLQGLAFLGGDFQRIYVPNNSDDACHVIRLDTSFDKKFDLPTGSDFPRGVAYAKNLLWFLDGADRKFYLVDPLTDAPPTTGATSYDLHSENTTPLGCTYFESINEIWVTDNGSTKKIFRYDADDGSYIGQFNVTATGDISGITYIAEANEAFMLEQRGARVRRISSTFAGLGTYNLDSRGTQLTGITASPGKLWVGDNGTDALFKYDLTIVLDLTFGSQAVADKTYTAGDTGSFVLPEATGGEGALTYSLSGLPTGFTFDAASRRVTVNPSQAVAETEVTYTVRDAAATPDTATLTFNITVNAQSDVVTPLSFESQTIGDITVRVGASASFVLPEASGGIGTKTYTLPSLPTGFRFNSQTRVLTIAPTQVVPQTQVTYTVRDSASPTAATQRLRFNITVNAASQTETQVLGFGGQTIGDMVFTAGETGSLVLPAARGGTGTKTYNITGLPSGITFTPGTRRLTVAPTQAAAQRQITYTVTDSATPTPATATLTFNITVNAASQPQATTLTFDEIRTVAIEDKIFRVNDMERFTLPEATGGTGEKTYRLTGLPTGFSFDAQTREVTVAPTEVIAQTEVTYKVTDAASPTPATDTLTFNITVNAAGTLFAPHGLSVSFPSATTALLEWSHARDAAELKEYQINYAKGGLGATWKATGSTRTRYLVKNLERGTAYTFAVRGVSDDDEGPASGSVTKRTPIASLNNCLFFKECVNYFDDGARVSKYGAPATLIHAAADNDYRTFTSEKDLVLNIAVNGQPTRVDAIFVKGIDIEGHSAEPTGGTGSGYSDRRMPSTVKNWEGTEVSTMVNGLQHDLYLLPAHFTAKSVRLTFTGANAKIYEVMCLEFGREIDANADFTEIATNFVDREGIVHSDPGGGIVYDSPIGNERDKWEIDYVVRVVPGKTLLETPEDFLYWRSENRNHVFCMEPSRFPGRVFPAVFVRKRVPVRYRSDDKTGGEIINFRVAEQ